MSSVGLSGVSSACQVYEISISWALTIDCQNLYFLVVYRNLHLNKILYVLLNCKRFLYQIYPTCIFVRRIQIHTLKVKRICIFNLTSGQADSQFGQCHIKLSDDLITFGNYANYPQSLVTREQPYLFAPIFKHFRYENLKLIYQYHWYQWETWDFYKNCLQFFFGVGIYPWAHFIYV